MSSPFLATGWHLLRVYYHLRHLPGSHMGTSDGHQQFHDRLAHPTDVETDVYLPSTQLSRIKSFHEDGV